MHKFFSIFYGLFLGFVITLGALFLLTFVPLFGIEVKIVQSGSMEPALPLGSMIIVLPAEKYREGDIITFGSDTREAIPTTHRIVSISAIEGEMIYRVKGDANENEDPKPVETDEVIGKVVFHIPYLGYILDLAKKPWGFALLIGIPALLVIVDELTKMYREGRRLIRERKKETTSPAVPPNTKQDET